MDRTILIDRALAFLEIMVARDKEYDKLNKKLRALNEFPSRLNLMDDKLHTPLNDLLDECLGAPGLSSYFLYEQPHALVQCLDKCHCNGKEWPLRTIEQLRNYVDHIHDIKKEAAA